MACPLRRRSIRLNFTELSEPGKVNRMTDEQDIDVVVVGAAPTGLLIAAELALGGVAVQVIARLAEPDPTVKAGSVNVATAEVLDTPPRGGPGAQPPPTGR